MVSSHFMATTLSKIADDHGDQDKILPDAHGRLKRNSFPRTNEPATRMPPLTLPGRGWGDGGTRRGFGAHFDPPQCTHLHEKIYESRCDTSSSSASTCTLSGGSSISSSGASSSRSGVGCVEGVELKCFDVADGFSSAEEETWGSEGEIEETNAAGRHAVVCAVRRKALDSRVSESTAEDTQPQQHGGGVASPEDSTRHDSTSEGSDLEDESEQGRDEIQALLERVVAPVRDRRSSRAMYNDFNGGERALPGRRASTGDADGRGTEGVRPGGFLARNVAAARLPSTGVERKPVHATGTSRGPTRGSRGVTSASRRGRRCSSRDGGDDGRGRSTQRPLRLSRPLFIEIENKASERPLRAAIVGARGKGKAQRRPKTPARKRSAVAEQEEREESDVDSDDEREVLCGCAQRCLRQVDAWYHYFTGNVKFSELTQNAPATSV